MSGTIRKREAKQVMIDFLTKEGVPASAYGFDGDSCVVLVGSRKATAPCSSKMTFWQLSRSLERLRTIVEERKIARDSRQRDIEEYTGAPT